MNGLSRNTYKIYKKTSETKAVKIPQSKPKKK